MAPLSPLADGRVYPYVVSLGSDGSWMFLRLTSFLDTDWDVAGDVFCGRRVDTAHSG